MQNPNAIVIGCEYCQGKHLAEYSHDGRFNEGPIYTAVCTSDWIEANYTLEAEIPGSDSKAPRDVWGNMIATAPLGQETP